MNKVKYIICTIIFFFFLNLNVTALANSINSENAILYNLDENTILFTKNPDEVISIASLTKIMTAIIVIENVENLEEKIVLINEDFKELVESNAAVAGFYIGEEVTIKDLLYGLLFPSGAEAAQALTRYFGGKERFVELMNEKAKELGLQNTKFKNETGLDEEGHHSTVREVGTFFQYALKNETFKNIIETKEYQTSNKRKIFQSTIVKFINKTNLSVDYLRGGKTGTTANAGLCLASIAESNGTNYMLITARAKNDWINPTHLYDAKTIYDYHINHYENKILLEQEEKILDLKTKYAKEENIPLYNKKEILKYVSKEFKKEDLKISYDGIEEITPFMKKGTKLGILTITYLDEEIMKEDIILEEELHFDLIKIYELKKKEIHYLFLIILIIIIIILNRKKRKKQRKLQKKK